MKQYEDGIEFKSSTHMQKVADKQRLARQRGRNHHDNNRDRETRFEWDENGRGQVVCYISASRIVPAKHSEEK